jgi:S1-C subfamily serine protease
MNLLGPVAKFAAALMGKQPEEELHPRGFLGLELGEEAEGGIRIDRVLPETAAAKAGVQAGDQLVRLLDRDVKSVKAALGTVDEIRPGDQVPLTVRRGSETRELTLTAGEGF